jgi:uncharacterized protein
MLIEFTFRNFRSFREQTSISLIAAEGLTAAEEVTERNVFRAQSELNLLRVAAIYGANASGKSNLLRAFSLFRQAVVQSADSSFRMLLIPFAMDTISDEQSSLLEATFLLDGSQYRYGFEAIRHQGEVTFPSEWLFKSADDVEETLFIRDVNTFEVLKFPDIEVILDDGRFMRNNALVLSVSAQIPKNKASIEFVEYIKEHFRMISGLTDGSLRRFTEKSFEKGEFTSQIRNLMSESDTGIADVRCMEEKEIASFSQLVEEENQDTEKEISIQRMLQDHKIQTVHKVYDEKRHEIGVVHLPLHLFESEGTKKLFAFAGPVWDVLENGRVLFVDEMDARWHPMLTRGLIQLFQSDETNPKNAQLIFATHDTNLLDGKFLRRDQIWFVEKDRFGASHLYSLADLKVDPDTESYEQEYFAGRYGAIPFLGGLRRLFRYEETTGNDIESDKADLERDNVGT